MRLVHIADVHLGYRAYNKVNNLGVNVRESDVFDAFRQAVDKTVEIKPDLIVIAGDLFHSVRPSNLTIYHTYRAIRSLRTQISAPLVIIGGNHDSPRSTDVGCILELFTNIDGVYVVHAEPKQIRFSELDASVFCLPHNALPFKSEIRIAPDPESRYNILVAHARPEGADKGYDQYFLTRQDVREEEWGYVAYGHLHSFREVAPNAYHPGSLEFAGGLTVWDQWSEDAKKGFIEYDLDRGAMQRHFVKTRRIVDVPQIDASGLTASELDELIQCGIAGVRGGVADKIIRLVALNVSPAARADINYSALRQVRAEALHFELDLRRPDSQALDDSGERRPARALEQEWEDLAASLELPTGVDRERLRQLGRDYLGKAQAWEEQ